MKLTTFIQIAERYWQEQRDKHTSIPPEAKVVTGLACNDAFFHWMLIDNGVEMVIEDHTPNIWRLIDFRVVDEKKFAWFILRWA